MSQLIVPSKVKKMKEEEKIRKKKGEKRKKGGGMEPTKEGNKTYLPCRQK